MAGIIRNRTLFATHADYSNNSSECRLVIPYLTKILSEEFEKYAPQLVELGLMDRRIAEFGNRELYDGEAKNCVEAMLQTVNNISPYFITSFCIHEQNDYEYSNGLLSQWRAYARGGFAIEFDEQKIDGLNHEEYKALSYAGIITNTVSYENHETQVNPELFRGMAGPFLRNLLRVDEQREQVRSAFNRVVGTAEIGDFVKPFLSLAPFLKHYGFKEESEYRIVAICNRPTRITPDDKRVAKKIRFKARRNGDVVPFIALYENFEKTLPIKAIIIGPHAEQENQRHSVELLLEQHGIVAEVRVSRTPFRA